MRWAGAVEQLPPGAPLAVLAPREHAERADAPRVEPSCRLRRADELFEHGHRGQRGPRAAAERLHGPADVLEVAVRRVPISEGVGVAPGWVQHEADLVDELHHRAIELLVVGAADAGRHHDDATGAAL